MVRLTVTHKKMSELSSKNSALFIFEGQEHNETIRDFSKAYFPNLFEYIEEHAFHGALGSIIALPVQANNTWKTVFLVGLGKKDSATAEQFMEACRRAAGTLIKALQARKLASCRIYFPVLSTQGFDTVLFVRNITVAMQLAAYAFDDYITDSERKVVQDIELELFALHEEEERVAEGIRQGTIITKATNRVRHWIDLPPCVLTPTDLAQKAQSIAQEYQLPITIFDEKKINELGMGGLAAVSAGSHQDCKLVIMEYRTEKKNAPTIALVGKGITFDSGGLSIKPADSMETMKEDMSGAAAVLGTMQAIAQLKPAVNVIALTPLSENLPSGTATKPGDIVRFYNGKTAEIKNTDAEGRLILADALSYAVKHYKLDAIIDIATLTGSCAAALGPFFTGIMGHDQNLINKIKEAAVISGERVWQLPFDADYKKAIISDVADISNIGKRTYMAGAITAGYFLAHFVDSVPWVHLDIAGTAFDVPDMPYYRTGATGVGVRLFVDLLMHWESK